MAPRHPRGAASGREEEGSPSAPASAVHRERSPRDDSAFIEEVVQDLLAQNERAQAQHGRAPAAGSGAPADAEPAPEDLDKTVPSAGVVEVSAERPRTVRVERDSGFRTPEGAATARAYLPARTLLPGRSEQVEAQTVQVNDPRKLPTMRLPREQREAIRREGAGRGPKSVAPPPEDSAPTLRSAPLTPPAVQRNTLGLWVGGVVVVALLGVLVVALATRLWPSAAARPAPSASASVSASVRAAIVAPTAAPLPSAAVSAVPTASASAEPASSAEAARSGGAPAQAASASGPKGAPRGAPKSDRWF